MSTESPVILERQQDRATVRLNRPTRHNGMNLAMLDAVNETARALTRDRSLRSVIIEGAGPSFCAGLDFKSVFASPLAAAPAMAELWLPYANRFQRWSLGPVAVSYETAPRAVLRQDEASVRAA